MSTYLILVADAELDGAEAAEAEKYAPYEYTAAKAYLHKAREEQGYADFGAAIEYAFKAQELAEKGLERANKVKAEQQPPPGAPTAPVDVPPEPPPSSPADGIIIRKKPEEPPPPADPNPSPTPSPELVPPTGEAPPPDSADEEKAVPPALEVIPLEPPQPPTTETPE